MKLHLMIMTAMLSFCITHNCGAQTAEKKNKGVACAKGEDCKSNVCGTDNKCGDGNKAYGEACSFDEECVVPDPAVRAVSVCDAVLRACVARGLTVENVE